MGLPADLATRITNSLSAKSSEEPFQKPTNSKMPAAANVSPITIETTFAINIGFLLAFLSEENHNMTKRGTNVAEQVQVTISNWYNGLNDVTSILMNCPTGFGGSVVA